MNGYAIGDRIGLPARTLVIFDPEIGRAIGRVTGKRPDVDAALYIQQLWFLSRRGERAVDATVEQIEDATLLSGREQRRVRRLLVGIGWTTEKVVRVKSRSRLIVTLNVETIGADVTRRLVESDAEAAPRDETEPHGVTEGEPTEFLWGNEKTPSEIPPGGSKKTKERDAAAQLALAPDPSFDAILAGTFDHLSAKDLATKNSGEQVLRALVGKHRSLWGMTKSLPSPVDRKAWSSFLSMQRPPSEAAKAILGMIHDDPPRDGFSRGDFNALKHVINSIDRWVKLYDERHVRGVAPNWPRKKQAPMPDDFARYDVGGREVWLPWPPDNADEHAASTGLTFAIPSRKWTNDKDPTGAYEAHREAYGAVNTPAARRSA